MRFVFNIHTLDVSGLLVLRLRLLRPIWGDVDLVVLSLVTLLLSLVNGGATNVACKFVCVIDVI